MIKYTDKQKLDAVKAYRKGGGGLIATAAAQGVNVASLRKWVAGYDSQGDAGVVTKGVASTILISSWRSSDE